MITVCYRLTPKDVHVHIHGTCEHATLHGKRDFADMVSLRILEREDFPELYEWVQCNHESPSKRKCDRGSQLEQDYWWWKRKLEGYGEGHLLRRCMATRHWKKQDVSLEFTEGTQLCQHWFSSIRPFADFWLSELQDNKLVLLSPW